MRYPYHLGVHLKTSTLCRIPHPDLGCGVPDGFARVVSYKEVHWRVDPYDADGELRPRYWSTVRWTDVQRTHGEPRTGPLMLAILLAATS